VGMVRDFWVP